MSVEEMIIQHIHTLSESEKAEVLNFIEFVKARKEQKERSDWSELSLSSAMRGMEDEPTPYSVKDIKESFS